MGAERRKLIQRIRTVGMKCMMATYLGRQDKQIHGESRPSVFTIGSPVPSGGKRRRSEAASDLYTVCYQDQRALKVSISSPKRFAILLEVSIDECISPSGLWLQAPCKAEETSARLGLFHGPESD